MPLERFIKNGEWIKKQNRSQFSGRIHYMKLYQEEYRVTLIGIGRNTHQEKELFCTEFSKKYSISYTLLRKTVDDCPIIIKKNITREKAGALAGILKSFGAQVAVEVRRDVPPISLEFQNMELSLLVLESASLRKTREGGWDIVGRVKNIASEGLNDIWVLIQLFGNLKEFLTFDEVPLALNPLPPEETAPFKAIFEGDFSIQKISIAFKNASGMPLAALDKRITPEWKRAEWGEGDEAVMSIDLIQSPPPISFETLKEEMEMNASLKLLRQDPQPSKSESGEIQVENPPEGTEKTKERSAKEPTSYFLSDKVAITTTIDNENRSIPSESGKEDLAEIRMGIETTERKIGKRSFYPIERRVPWKA